MECGKTHPRGLVFIGLDKKRQPLYFYTGDFFIFFVSSFTYIWSVKTDLNKKNCINYLYPRYFLYWGLLFLRVMKKDQKTRICKAVKDERVKRQLKKVIDEKLNFYHKIKKDETIQSNQP